MLRLTFLCDVETGLEENVSLNYNNERVSGFKYSPTLSEDGRFVEFSSDTNLTQNTPSPGNTQHKHYLRDRQTGQISLLSLDNNGNLLIQYVDGQHPEHAITLYHSSISPDGNYLIFDARPTRDFSVLDAPLAGVVNNSSVFVRDIAAGQTSFVSQNPDPSVQDVSAGGGSISRGGRFAAFDNGSNRVGSRTIIVLRDRQNRETFAVTRPDPDGSSSDPVIDANGDAIAFSSSASNLLPRGEDTNYKRDVFVVSLQRHAECQGNACTLVEGIGPDKCWQDSDCPVHLDCLNGACTPFPGAGPNYCSDDTQCGHLECRGGACARMSGVRPDTCTSNADCSIERHSECRNNACESVLGAGGDLCFTNSDCAPHHYTCRQNMCSFVAGDGTSNCHADSDCSTVTTHSVCRNNRCIEVQGAGVDECQSNLGCSPHYYTCRQNMCTLNLGEGTSECSEDHDCLACKDDADGGNNPYQKGILTEIVNKVEQNYPDTCCGKDFLKEYFCSEGGKSYRWYQCKLCADGRCVRSAGEARPRLESNLPAACR